MAIATLSSKYQVVIPKEIREETGLSSGEKLVVIVKDGIINLIPAHRISNLRGFIKGMDTKIERDEGERI